MSARLDGFFEWFGMFCIYVGIYLDLLHGAVKLRLERQLCSLVKWLGKMMLVFVIFPQF